MKDKETTPPKALVAMSGGVDSSVAAFLTAELGYDCIGATMKLISNSTIGLDRQKTCCSLDDVLDAKSAANRLGIPHYTLNFTKDFETQVIRRFARAYEKGKTPNPCIDCNKYIKFESLLHRARELECSKLVTGHYARIRQGENGRMLLLRAKDLSKDQSYFLYTMTQPQLAHTLFPLGDLSKPEVRDIASKLGLSNANKRDSQDICFVPSGSYAAFLEKQAGSAMVPGDFVDSSGNVLGRHSGIARYTIGQRRGLGLAFAQPMYVTGISAEDNRVTLGRNQDLFSSVLYADNINLIKVPSIENPIQATAKIRSAQQEQPVTVCQIDQDRLSVTFSTPQRAVTPGQAVVIYDGEYVIGGGTIC